MPKAAKGESKLFSILSVADKISGVLIQCDPSIKTIIMKIDEAKNDYVIQELDDQTLVIKENMLASLKYRLDEVRLTLHISAIADLCLGGEVESVRPVVPTNHNLACEYTGHVRQ